MPATSSLFLTIGTRIAATRKPSEATITYWQFQIFSKLLQKYIEKVEKKTLCERFLFSALNSEYVLLRSSVFPYTSKCRSQSAESSLTSSLKSIVKAGLRGIGITLSLDTKFIKKEFLFTYTHEQQVSGFC